MLLLATACGADPEAALIAERAPSYGPPRHMIGDWSSNFEHSGFVECRSWAECKLDEKGCWFETSSKFRQAFEETVPPDPILKENPFSGTYFINFEGQLAVGGSFGHLNQYACQVRGLNLASAERQQVP
jgi:hypothetical protein